MDTKKLILDRLIECNPDSQELKDLTLNNFTITDIQPVSERTSHNGVKVNSRVRLRCLIDTGWVGSRWVWFYRYDAATTIPEQLQKANPTSMLPATINDIVRSMFANMNLDFVDGWVEDGGNIIASSQPVTVTFTEKSLYFTGTIEIAFTDTKRELQFLPINSLDLWKPMLPNTETRINLLLYSLEFVLQYSGVANKDVIKQIDSQEKLNIYKQTVLDVITDLSGEEWLDESNASSPRPGGCLMFKFNGNVRADGVLDRLYGKYTMAPINFYYSRTLLLTLVLPQNSQCRYVGDIAIYY